MFTTLSWLGAKGNESNGPSAFYKTLIGSSDVQTTVPSDRWDIDSMYTPNIAAGMMTINVRYALLSVLRAPRYTRAK